MPKDTRITIRLADDLRTKVERACKLTGLDEPTVVRACLEAFAEHVEHEGGIWLPLAIVPKSKGAPAPSTGSTARSLGGHSLSDAPAAPRPVRLTGARKVLRAEALKHPPKK